MKLTTLLIVVLLLLGCAEDPPLEISYHTISIEELAEICPEDYPGCDSSATWYPNNTCDVYLLPEWVYTSLYCDAVYEALKSHEERHCREGDWHDKGYRVEACEEER